MLDNAYNFKHKRTIEIHKAHRGDEIVQEKKARIGCEERRLVLVWWNESVSYLIGIADIRIELWVQSPYQEVSGIDVESDEMFQQHLHRR